MLGNIRFGHGKFQCNDSTSSHTSCLSIVDSGEARLIPLIPAGRGSSSPGAHDLRGFVLRMETMSRRQAQLAHPCAGRGAFLRTRGRQFCAKVKSH